MWLKVPIASIPVLFSHQYFRKYVVIDALSLTTIKFDFISALLCVQTPLVPSNYDIGNYNMSITLILAIILKCSCRWHRNARQHSGFLDMLNFSSNSSKIVHSKLMQLICIENPAYSIQRHDWG